MAFNTLPDSIIQVGKALTRELFKTYIKDNLDDLNTRTSAVEAATNKIVIYNGTIYGIGRYASATGLLFHRVQSGIDITDCKVVIYDKGAVSSGTLQVDVQTATSADFASSVSIFTTKPSLDLSTAASYAESSNAVIGANGLSLAEGDWLRIDIDSIPTGLGKCAIYLIGEPS